MWPFPAFHSQNGVGGIDEADFFCPTLTKQSSGGRIKINIFVLADIQRGQDAGLLWAELCPLYTHVLNCKYLRRWGLLF